MPHVRRSLIVATLGLFAFPSPTTAQTSLDSKLTPYLEKYGMPALAAAVVKDGTVVAVGAVGTRRVGERIPVTVNDRFHIGSDTKAMTSLVVAMYVEAGKLRWDSTVSEVFPELKTIDPGLAHVTVEQLLSHTSGVPADNPDIDGLINQATFASGNLDEQRYWLLSKFCTKPLTGKAGEKFVYANMNYVIAGAMLERLSGKTWEELVVDRVFTPFGLKTAGFGPQSSLGRVDAPLGHQLVDGKLKAFLAGPNGDNPMILGPAGTVHMSVLDFAAWAGWNASEGKRGPAVVNPKTLKKLHTPVVAMLRPDAKPGTPPSGQYALGWGEVKGDWAPDPLIFHGGSNEKNLAYVFLDVKRDLAIVIMSNVSGTRTEEGFRALAPELYANYSGWKPVGK